MSQLNSVLDLRTLKKVKVDLHCNIIVNVQLQPGYTDLMFIMCVTYNTGMLKVNYCSLKCKFSYNGVDHLVIICYHIR